MATPSLAMIPSGYKASKVYSVLPESGVGDFDFTRATTATRINSSGLIEEMAINVPRLEYPLIDGVVNGCPSLLLEPQRTNLITDSQTFTGTLSQVNRESNSTDIKDPFGTNTAFKFTVLTSGADANTRITNSISVTNFSVSIYVNGLAGQKFELFLARDSYSQIFSTQEVLSGGWQRIELNGTFSTSSTTVVIGLEFGFGSDDSVAGQEYYLTGLQLEEGSYATSYIPTQGSAVTRLADVCNNGGNEQVINSTEGTLYLETATLVNTQTADNSITLTDGGNNKIIFRYRNTNAFNVKVFVNGVAQAEANHTLSNATDFNKIAVKWKLNDYEIYVNGISVFTDSNALVFPNNSINSLGFADALSTPFYGKTKAVAVYKEALTDAELQALTT